MALVCLFKSSTFSENSNHCENRYFIFHERDSILNNLTLCTIQFLSDSMITTRNGLITKYDLLSPELTFVTKMLTDEFNTFRIFPPILKTDIKSFDLIYIR